MTEKEKMLAGELYDAGDPELIEGRRLCRELMELYNASGKSKEERLSVIKELLGKHGESVSIELPFRCDYGYNISVGENFYANFNCVFLDVNKITIGDNALIGPNVQLYTAGHPIDPIERKKELEYGLPITIGNNVWIGGGAIVCPGVSIGDNVVIGAGSVVTKNIPSNVVAVGNPCVPIKSVNQSDAIV